MSDKTLSARRPSFGLSRTFNDFFEPWNDWFREGAAAQLTSPKVNVSETPTSFNLDVAAPGLHKKDFRIDVNGNVLTISAQKEENKEEKEEKYTRTEYNYSSFSRSFTMPEEVQQDKIEATYDGGILKLTLPKNEKAAQQLRKEITIK